MNAEDTVLMAAIERYLRSLTYAEPDAVTIARYRLLEAVCQWRMVKRETL